MQKQSSLLQFLSSQDFSVLIIVKWAALLKSYAVLLDNLRILKIVKVRCESAEFEPTLDFSF